MEKIAYKDGKRIGKVIHETTLYFVEMDADRECYAYAELDGCWVVGDVRDLDDRSEKTRIEEEEPKPERPPQ